ncbi:MAG: hypothetical protein C0598_11840 [Marinilabiliales bacterium]|nr:MAG: hypothetical protein C0598_11840 [Marinilabiliales bacterium]
MNNIYNKILNYSLLLKFIFSIVLTILLITNALGQDNDSLLYNKKGGNKESPDELLKNSKRLSVQFAESDLQKSLFHDIYSLSLIKTKGDQKAVDSLLNIIWKKQSSLSNYRAADTTLNLILNNYLKSGEKSELADLKYNIALNKYNLSSYKIAEQYFNEALNDYEKNGDKPGIAKSLKGLAVVVTTWGDYEKAIGLLQNSREIYEDLQDENGLAGIYISLGVVMQDWNKYDRAMDYFKQAYNYFKNNKDYLNEMNALMHIGDIFLKNEEFTKCIKYNRKALNLRKQVNNKRLYSIALSNIGEAFYKLNDLDSALFYQKKSLNIKLIVGDEKRVAISYLILGDIFKKKNERDSAEFYLMNALSLSRKINYNDIELKSLKSISELYSKQNNFYRAYTYLKEYQILKELTFDENTNKNLEELNIKYQSEKRETENKLLKQNNEIQRLQLEREKTSRFYLIIFASFIILITFILIFFVNSRIKNSRKNYSILAYKNKEITRQKEKLSQLNNELAESRESFKGIVDNATIGIYQTNQQGEVLFANKNLIKTLGYKNLEDIKKINVNDSYFDRPRFLTEIQEKGVITGREEKWLGADGKEMYVLESAWLVRNSNGSIKYIEGIVEDVTKRRIAEKSLQDSQQELKLSNKKLKQKNKEVINAIKEDEAAYEAKSKFIANISHEIRTPMNAIIGFTELLLRLEEDPKKSSYIYAIDSSSKSLLTLINDILDLSKIQAGKLNLNYEPIALSTVINELKQLFKLQLKNKGIDFIIEQNIKLKDYINIDGVRLRQILLNLIGNATKFTKKGVITVKFNYLKNKNNTNLIDLEVIISDTGPGISKKDQKTIFTAFSQGSILSQDQNKGTGLGLAITKQLIEMMRGSLKLESELGKGSTFTILLPNIETIKTKGSIKIDISDDISNNDHIVDNKLYEEDTNSEFLSLEIDFKNEFKKNFLEDYIKISNNKIISEIAEFNKKIMYFAEQSEINELLHYAREMDIALKKFDIDTIEHLLAKLKIIFNDG